MLDIGFVHADSVVAGTPVRLAGTGADVPADPTADAVLPNATGVAYGLFVPDPASRSLLARALPSLRPALARAAAWLDLRELMLEGGVAPVAMLDLAGELVAREEDELLVQQVLDDLVELYWRYVPRDARAERAGRLEARLWTRLREATTSSRKAAYFNAWRSIATSPAALDRMTAIWEGELEVEGLPLSERDRTTLALHLAVRGVPGAESILDRQAAAIDNPDRRERFEFIRPAVSADAAVRDSFFDALGRAENRGREEWVVTALSYLHHPVRARESVHYLRPALELLPEIRATGDIFFPTRWLDATLSGHASDEAAAVVRGYIEDTPDLPPRLLGKLQQEADPLFRAARLRRAAR
ncbi:MAG: hypothetical protein GWM90_28410 [Gemmatimonadetes bacterium]|nr:hypothetical protein [Gemmatimonadota bacterium]NIQ58955.1 hypothetical protein [Gemmatimonadota bacterium]NIU79145.1 hypothetical protein [Gammaproteobacteria bacterium]NIX47850.1 hypothetical protein [Gemmatimonadota bacterium]NIY12215.1 hypothetical protein [Gemmatimonadota bacterium]